MKKDMKDTMDTKPEWYSTARSLHKDERQFTDEMKQLVISRIYRKPHERNYFYLKGSMALLVAVLLVTSLLAAKDSFPTGTLTMESIRPAAPGGEGNGSVNKAGADERALHYQFTKQTPAKLNEHKLERTPLEKLSLSSVIIQEETELNGFGKMIIYKKNEEDQITYFGITLNNAPTENEGKFYEIGPGAPREAKMEKSSAFGEANLRFYGYGGPVAQFSYWLRIEGDHVYFIYSLDAEAFEADLNGDGAAEVITTPYEGGRIYIYMKRGEQVEWAEATEALDFDPSHQRTITYDDDREVFIVKDSEYVKYYKYATNGEDKLILLGN